MEPGESCKDLLSIALPMDAAYNGAMTLGLGSKEKI